MPLSLRRGIKSLTTGIKTSFKEGLGWFWLFVIFLLVSTTYVDFVVNNDLYKYGLIYNFDWFIRYGVGITLMHIAIPALISIAYWFSSAKQRRHKFTVGAIFITILAMWGGGFLDWVWFFFDWVFDGVLIQWGTVWWWMPFYWLFGIEWTTVHHLVYTIVWGIVLALLWYKVSKLR